MISPRMTALCVGAAFVLGAATAAAQAGRHIAGQTQPTNLAGNVRLFLQDNPRSGIYEWDQRVSRVYGQAFSHGATPQASAAAFIAEHAGMFGVAADELALGGPFLDGRHVQPIMYQPDTGTYKFTGVYYRQEKAGVPVFRSRLMLLVRNEAGYPLVLASANIRPTAGFEPQVAQGAMNPEKGIAAALKLAPSLVNFTEPQLVIWAGVDDMLVKPALAYTFTGDNGEPPEGGAPEKYLFVADAVDGTILYMEDEIIFVDVLGNVQGKATEGVGAEHCEDEVPMALPYARVNISGTVAYTDANGDFVIPWAGSSQVTVESRLWGTWFRVFNAQGAESMLPLNVVPPGPANFMHNDANTSEYVRAEVNGYLQANIVRDFTLVQNPSYPGLQENEFEVNVNRNDFYCPGNAWYSGDSINFCLADSGYPNTAWSSVIHHEYGHHLVEMGGSGQGQYGEGMSDTVGLLIADDPGTGYGFYGPCNDPLRTGDNNMQYPCSGSIHTCGQLLSGCVWSTRNELIITNPTAYMEILSNLAINAILMHSGDMITPAITVDYLTLDDDDGNILNGTPHYNEINAGFGAHNMPGPELETDLKVTPSDHYTAGGPNGGPFTPSMKVYTLINNHTAPIQYAVTENAPWLNVTSTGGTIPVGGQTNVALQIDAIANTYPNGQYTEVVAFTNLTTGEGDTTRVATLNVGAPGLVYSYPMDTDPGWSTEGLWAFGQPTGGGGQYGNPDPTSGHTGPYVYGYNLNGDYENMLPERDLTTDAIDCSNLTQVQLKFWRYLGVEQPAYDHAYIRVSNNGSTWTTIWENPAEITDANWGYHEYDISAVADNQATVYIRWVMGTTDIGWRYCGWNIDDVEIWGVLPSGPQCPADVNGDNVVDVLDLLAVLAAWGNTSGPEDINGDGVVDVLDLLELLASWGPCP